MVQNCGAQQIFGSASLSLNRAAAWSSTCLFGDNLIHSDNGRAWPLAGLFKLPLNTITLDAFHSQGTLEVNLWEEAGQDEVDLNCCPSEFGDCRAGLWAALWQGCWEKTKPEIELSRRMWVDSEGGSRRCCLWTKPGQSWPLMQWEDHSLGNQTCLDWEAGSIIYPLCAWI